MSLEYETCKYARDNRVGYMVNDIADLLNYIAARVPPRLEDVSEGYEDFKEDVMNALEDINHKFDDLYDKIRELDGCVHDLKFGRGD